MLVLNFESRGTQGPLLMFETSNDNKNLARMLQETVKEGSTCFSFAAAVYKTMPNDTDLTEFLEAGYTGMNFAVVNGEENYHTEFDNIEVLDKDTAYMYASTIEDLVLSMADYKLERLKAGGDGGYFPVFKGKNIIMSKGGTNILGVVSCVLFLALIIYMGVKKQIKGKNILRTIGMICGACLLSAGAVYIIGLVCEKVYEPMDHTILLYMMHF